MSTHLRLLDPVFGDSFDTALRRYFSPAALDLPEMPALKMRIDVSESDQGYHVKADIPGAKKEDIHVRIDGNLVQIDAQCQSATEKKEGERVLRSERYRGAITRSFTLASDIDEAGVEARYADGVLNLDLPKRAAPSGRKITVE